MTKAGEFEGLDRFDDRWWRAGTERAVLSHFRFHSSLGDIEYKPERQDDDSWLCFVCDGGTVPRIGWSIVDPFGIYFPAFVVHDLCWAERDVLGYTFSETNQILSEAMLAIDLMQEKDPGGDNVSRWIVRKAVDSLIAKRVWKKGVPHVGDKSYHYARIEMSEPRMLED